MRDELRSTTVTVVKKVDRCPRGSAHSAQLVVGSKFLKYAPIGPVLPTPPTHKSFAVNKWPVAKFHGMEAVNGSLP